MRSNSDYPCRADEEMQRRESGREAIKSYGCWMMRDESGQTLVVVALCLTLLMGVMALVVDVGFVRYQQRQLQTAADAAAIAAGLELGDCGKTVCSNMITAAETALKEDGITTVTITPTTNSGTTSCTPPTPGAGLTMMINVSPCMLGASDPNLGNVNMAEVVLTQPQKMLFGGFVGMRSMNLVARAEAGDAYISGSSSGGNCIYTNGMLFNSSNGNFTLNSCGVYDNGNLQTNSGDSVTASTFLYYGSWSPNNCNSSCVWNIGGTNTGPPTKTTTQQSDPLSSLTQPSQPGNSPTYTMTTPNSGTTLQPGYYPNGVNLNSNVAVTLAPGLYYMNGSINVGSGASLSGTGVELFFANGSLQPNSGSTVTLTGPATTSSTAGTTANMVIWESKTNSTGMYLDADSNSYYNGIIYLPDAGLTLNSGSGNTINSKSTSTAVDVQSITVNSGINFVINGSGGYLGGSPSQVLGQFGLAE